MLTVCILEMLLSLAAVLIHIYWYGTNIEWALFSIELFFLGVMIVLLIKRKYKSFFKAIYMLSYCILIIIFVLLNNLDIIDKYNPRLLSIITLIFLSVFCLVELIVKHFTKNQKE